MLTFYYNPKYKYTNRTIIDVTGDTNKVEKDYETIDTVDGINGHLIYTISTGETMPTYIIETVSDERRWFVSGMTQLRQDKFQISLMRDIISEHPELWKTEEAYINAGKATNYNKYKTWSLPYTNTKVNQEKLVINGKPSYFVYYVNTQNISQEGLITETDLKLNASVAREEQYDYVVSNLNEIPSHEYIGQGVMVVPDNGSTNIDVITNTATSGRSIHKLKYSSNNGSETVTTEDVAYGTITNNYMNIQALNLSDFNNNINNSKTNFKTAVKNWWETHISGQPIMAGTDFSNLEAYVGKLVYNTGDNHTYRLVKNPGVIEYFQGPIYSSDTGTLRSALANITWPVYSYIVTNPQNYQVVGDYFVNVNYEWPEVSYAWEDLGTNYTFDFTFPCVYRKLPKSAVRCVNIVSDNNFSDAIIGQALMSMQANAGNPDDDTGRILDIQYLPFSIATTTNNNFKIDNTPITAQILSVDEYTYTVTKPALNNINKECDSIKIVSPSRASQYLFRPYNNNGNLTFGVKISLKPYTSVIYVRPNTTGLLMYNWDDKDCLIISEDFSLTQLSSPWANYVYNNRNYQNTFNREIQGREYERSWERQIEEVQKKSDEWTSRNISAQKAQTYTGNIPLISGIAGAIGTAWKDQAYLQATEIDRQYNQAMHEESIALATDQFNYQLDNIKSQPTIPSKITTIDGKLLDGIYLEYYSTNNTEKNAIENYYKYNGNRIDDYGTFNDYWCWFVRGKIIKSQYYTQPEINELNVRLTAGIFTGEVFNND